MKKVYIIDDDRNIVDSLSIVLNSNGYEVASQFDEESAVENIINFNADMVILDVMFPENDGAGFQLARLLKKDERTENIPILMLSAINEKGIYAGTFSNRDIDEMWLPVSEFIEKPIRPDVLLEKTQRMLS